jgi:hypothetical protein
MRLTFVANSVKDAKVVRKHLLRLAVLPCRALLLNLLRHISGLQR